MRSLCSFLLGSALIGVATAQEFEGGFPADFGGDMPFDGSMGQMMIGGMISGTNQRAQEPAPYKPVSVIPRGARDLAIEITKWQKELMGVMSSIKDKASADEAVKRLDDLTAKGDELINQMWQDYTEEEATMAHYTVIPEQIAFEEQAKEIQKRLKENKYYGSAELEQLMMQDEEPPVEPEDEAEPAAEEEKHAEEVLLMSDYANAALAFCATVSDKESAVAAVEKLKPLRSKMDEFLTQNAAAKDEIMATLMSNESWILNARKNAQKERLIQMDFYGCPELKTELEYWDKLIVDKVE